MSDPDGFDVRCDGQDSQEELCPWCDMPGRTDFDMVLVDDVYFHEVCVGEATHECLDCGFRTLNVTKCEGCGRECCDGCLVRGFEGLLCESCREA